MVQVTVAGMILDQHTRGPVLLLHIPPLNKYLPIWIGPSEAASIGMVLKKEKFERPLTHDLAVIIIDGLGGRVSKITITDQRNNTFYAKIFIERGQEVVGIDARPSDSIAIALRTGAPIFVSKSVLDQEKEHLLTLDEDAMRDIFNKADGSPATGGSESSRGSEQDPDSAEERDDSQEGDEAQ